MNNIQTSERIKLELKKNKKTLTNMIEDLGLSKSFIQNLTKRGSKPSIETMENIATYLNVSIDYLVGRDNEKSKIINKGSIESNGENCKNEIKFNSHEEYKYSKLDEVIIEMLKDLDIEDKLDIMKEISSKKKKKETT